MTNPEVLRARHREAMTQVRAALKPGDPRRFALLQRLDAIAVAIRVAETTKDKK